MLLLNSKGGIKINKEEKLNEKLLVCYLVIVLGMCFSFMAGGAYNAWSKQQAMSKYDFNVASPLEATIVDVSEYRIYIGYGEVRAIIAPNGMKIEKDNELYENLKLEALKLWLKTLVNAP